VGAAFFSIQLKVANLNLDQTGDRRIIFHPNFTPSNGDENGTVRFVTKNAKTASDPCSPL